VVSRHGDIDAEIINFGGFENWVRDAGELALHVGPPTDPQTGQHVTDILGVDEFGDPVEAGATGPEAGLDGEGPDNRWTPAGPELHWPLWSPRLVAETGEDAPDITVAVERVVWAFHCTACGTSSSDVADFEPTADPEQRRCQCGGNAERVPAVYCESCDTLILLRSTDPEAPA
jgi:hypothetical protein